jgi:hypothetical protein
VVDTGDPGEPEVVNETGPPDAGNPSKTTREPRIWQEHKILVVLDFPCSAVIHDCKGTVDPTLSFFDVSDPATRL